MNKANPADMLAGIRAAARRYPTCRIANCDCNDFGGVWEAGCHCFGHFKDMDDIFGKDNWKMEDFDCEGNRGYSSKLDRQEKQHGQS